MQLHPDMANIEVDLSVFGDGFVKMSPKHHDGVAGIVEGYFRRPHSPPGTDLRLIDACKRISCTSREDLPLPVILITIACCLAFLTPAASSTAAMLHGNDWTNTKSIWKIAPFLIVLSLIVASAVVILIGKVFL